MPKFAPSSSLRSLFLLAGAVLNVANAASPETVVGSVEREKARRLDYEQRGREALESGDAAMKDKDYEKATAYYKGACDLIPNAPKTQSSYNGALKSFCQASIRLAEQRITEGRYADAESVLRIVLDERYDPQCPQAVLILSHLEQPDYYNKTIGPMFRANVEQVKQYFIEAQGLYDSGRFFLAKKRCEQILNIDPTNIAARKFEEKIDRALSDYGVAAYNETRAHAIAETDMGWARPIRRFKAPTEIVVENTSPQASTERIRRKLERIVLPKLEFREATIREAIDFLKKKSVELDDFSPAGEKGVNIVLKLESSGGSAVAPTAAAPANAVPGIPGLEQPAPVPAAPAAPAAPAVAPVGSPADARITVSLTNIPLVEALKYVTGLANLKYKVEPYAVSVVPMTENTDVLVTKEWKIPPDLIPRTPGAGGVQASALSAPTTPAGSAGNDVTKGGTGIADRESAKNWLIANGVQFNGNASAVYIVKSSRLIVRNTQDQLDLVDMIVNQGPGIGPVQVEIEAKFVEIQQNNLKELSFDWTLGQFNLPGTQSTFAGGGTTGTSSALSASDYPFVDSSGNVVGSNPVTAGNRSGSSAISSNAIDSLLSGVTSTSKAPALAAIAGVFTDPQFQMVIRALNQKKGVDLLSSPKVTTKSGQRAVIEIVREFRYPTEFTPPQIPQTFGNTGSTTTATGTSTSGSFPVTPTTPTAFETRNTGVTLEVEPVVGPDGYTIDLNLVPQVVEFEGFINYGSPITSSTTNPITGVSTQTVITPNVINQPIFSTRKVTTSVSVYDGSTVVLGGLIREDVQKVEDKVPIIGDVPIIGRLFRSSVDQHIKRNLIIFVTARLINAAGEPIRAEEDKEEVIETLDSPKLSLPQELPVFSK